MQNLPVSTMPRWVPETVRRYLAHTEDGLSIRELARRENCHASTILRQVRRTETRRDDPLVDAALLMMAANRGAPGAEPVQTLDQADDPDALPPVPDDTTLNREAGRILRRLCETGSVLAVARGMQKAIVIRGDGDGGSGTRTAVVDVVIAQAMALLDWITCSTPGKVSRYQITASGRAALSRIVAESENQARQGSEAGFAEAQTAFARPSELRSSGARASKVRYAVSESPLIALARRRDKDGSPFLSDDLVRAGERLREDFELANMGTRITQNWERFLTEGVDAGPGPDITPASGPEAASRRVAEALQDLGPGLADVALRCCCHLEGLEVAEKRMGWSARSGKIVLRIALQRLKLFYKDPSAPDRNMVG